MLGIDEPCGEERSIINLFFPEYFLVAMPNGLMRWMGNGGESNGPIINPCLTSFSSRVETIAGSAKADWRLLHW